MGGTEIISWQIKLTKYSLNYKFVNLQYFFSFHFPQKLFVKVIR